MPWKPALRWYPMTFSERVAGEEVVVADASWGLYLYPCGVVEEVDFFAVVEGVVEPEHHHWRLVCVSAIAFGENRCY